LNKAVGSGEYDLPQGVTLGIDGVMRILGIPVYASTAINTPDYVVGDVRLVSVKHADYNSKFEDIIKPFDYSLGS